MLSEKKLLGISGVYMTGICAGFELGKKSRFAKNIWAKWGKKLSTGNFFFGFCKLINTCICCTFSYYKMFF